MKKAILSVLASVLSLSVLALDNNLVTLVNSASTTSTNYPAANYPCYIPAGVTVTNIGNSARYKFINSSLGGNVLAVQFSGRLSYAATGSYPTNAFVYIGKNLDGSSTNFPGGGQPFDNLAIWSIPLNGTNYVYQSTNFSFGAIPCGFFYAIAPLGATNLPGTAGLTNFTIKVIN